MTGDHKDNSDMNGPETSYQVEGIGYDFYPKVMLLVLLLLLMLVPLLHVLTPFLDHVRSSPASISTGTLRPITRSAAPVRTMMLLVLLLLVLTLLCPAANPREELVDLWYKTDDRESFVMSRRMIREEGLLCGGSCGR